MSALLDIHHPWQASPLYALVAEFGVRLLVELAAGGGVVVSDDETYRTEAEMDPAVPVHGGVRGPDAVLL